MRRIISMLLSLVMIASLMGCGQLSKQNQNQGDGAPTLTEADSTVSEAGIGVDKNLLSVEVTLPAHMVEQMTEEDIAAMTEENGFDAYQINTDGSLTYKMSRSKHREFLDNMGEQLDKTIEESVLDPDSSITGIEYNKSWSEFTISVDSEKYTVFDSLGALAYYLMGSYYQLFDGVSPDDIDVVVNFVDEDNNVLDSSSYKDWGEDAGEVSDDMPPSVSEETTETHIQTIVQTTTTTEATTIPATTAAPTVTPTTTSTPTVAPTTTATTTVAPSTTAATTVAPATTVATTVAPTTIGLSAGKKNALQSAKDYLRIMSFSRLGLIGQLEYEGYTTDEAAYGADNSGANWNEQAVKEAINYLEIMSFSRSGLISQLEYEGYTTEQATYGVDTTAANWNEQAVREAINYLEIMSFSRSGLIGQLEYEGYTTEQATYGVDNAGVSWD